jgi:hypothetical protein
MTCGSEEGAMLAALHSPNLTRFQYFKATASPGPKGAASSRNFFPLPLQHFSNPNLISNNVNNFQ